MKTLCCGGEIRNVMCLGLQRGWSKQTRQDVIDKKSIGNDGVLEVSDKNKKIGWKSYHE